MPDINLTIPTRPTIGPRGAYIRVAKVLRSYLNSKDIEIEFLDSTGELITDGYGVVTGSIPETATAEVVAMAPVPGTSYIVSGALFGRGDRVAVLVQGSNYYVISALDQFSNPTDTHELSNRPGYALAQDWIVFDVFNQMIIEINRNGASSHVDFYDPVAGVTRVTGDITRKNVLSRILDSRYGAAFETGTCHMADEYPYKYGFGPAQTTPRLINSKICHGRFINHLKAIHDMPFAPDGSMDATLSMYDQNVTDILSAEIEPSCTDPAFKWYEPAVIWSDTDSDPEYVICICCYPAYMAADPTMMEVRFLEVPVYALAERKMLDLDANGEVQHAWQKYSDDIRVIDTISRSYIDIDTFNFSGCSASLNRMHQAPVILVGPAANNVTDFCVYDGYGWTQDSSVYDAHRIRKTVGTITRTDMAPETPTASNGSRFEYVVSNTTPATVLNYYDVNVHYFDDNAGTVYEDHDTPDPHVEYVLMELGSNTLTRKIDIDYHADGVYDSLGIGGSSWSSNPGGSSPEGLNSCLNRVDYSYLYNDTEIFTDFYQFEFNTKFFLDHSYSYFLYANIEIGLFVFDRTIIDVESFLGPGAAGTGTRTRNLVVNYQGVEYIIWQLVETIDTFPSVWNFFPWINDSSYPARPTTPPYDLSVTPYTAVFFAPPFAEFFIDLKSDVEPWSKGYPCPGNDAISVPFVGLRKPATGTDDPSDYFQVNVLGNSWRVRCECFLDDAPANISVTYPGGSNTLYRLNGAAPTFTKPVIDNTLAI